MSRGAYAHAGGGGMRGGDEAGSDGSLGVMEVVQDTSLVENVVFFPQSLHQLIHTPGVDAQAARSARLTGAQLPHTQHVTHEGSAPRGVGCCQEVPNLPQRRHGTQRSSGTELKLSWRQKRGRVGEELLHLTHTHRCNHLRVSLLT